MRCRSEATKSTRCAVGKSPAMRCRSAQLDLYASATRLSLFEATVALCEQLHRDVPWMLNGTPLGPRSTDRYAPQLPSGREPSRRVGSIPEHGQTDRAATAQVVPTGPKKWYPF